MKNSHPTLNEETFLWNKGIRHVFGIDEAGRGCLAGPVYAAALAWSPSIHSAPPVRDSKQLTPERRECMYEEIQSSAWLFATGSAKREEIDTWNISRATSLAAARAVEAILQKTHAATPENTVFLSDGKVPIIGRADLFIHNPTYGKQFPRLRDFFQQQRLQEICYIKGDQKSVSIAAASILAKVSRDRYMEKLNKKFPLYDFTTHKGYPTPRHKELLQQYGPCKEHRISFSPVRACLHFGRGTHTE